MIRSFLCFALRACNKCGARGGHVFTDPQERDACPKFEWARAHRAEADSKWNRRGGEAQTARPHALLGE